VIKGCDVSRVAVLALFACLTALALPQFARADDTSDIAKKAQNPIASMISVPFQNSTTFGVGEHGDTADSLLIEPVIPITLSPDWNLVTRTIVPVIEQPTLAPGLGNVSGLGDIQLSLYLSPAQEFHGVIWGLGPSFSFATASDRSLGSGKDSVGLSTAVLTIRGHWLVGTLITDVASVGGEENRHAVHSFLIQPFVNYNFSKGWYLNASPIVTANWHAPLDSKWTVPIGGGGGKIMRIGKQAINCYLQAYDNVVRPHEAGNWTLRMQVQLLFPR
jgi:hypothetical protein